MKILTPLLILGLTTVVVRAEEFTIQLLASNQKVSMETVLEKAKKSGIFPEGFIGKDGRYILTTGIFNNRAAALKELSHVKTVSKDAFIRPTDPARVAYSQTKDTGTPVNSASVTTPVEVKYVIPAIDEKKPLVAEETTVVYTYNCKTPQSGIVIPADETATDIIVQYYCVSPLSKDFISLLSQP